jgi:cell wall-associated NlpC family hydrolase
MLQNKEDLKDMASAYASQLIGHPYRWGGEDPNGGFDCSGLVQEILRGVGLDPAGDQTAQALYNNFKSKEIVDVRKGCIAFYGKSKTEITHVAWLWQDGMIIEAGGGGSKTLTLNDAIKHQAFVRLRPVNHRKDLVAVVDPFL